MQKLFLPLLFFLLHLGYFGPVLMGILDSSFLFLPFGNDLLVISLTARNHHGLPWYVMGAAAGSTMGVILLVLVAGRLGKEGIKSMAGAKKYGRLNKMIGRHGAPAVALACMAPPPFPFTLVIAAASALDYSRRRIWFITFFTRAIRFLILGLLAIKYGRHILDLANLSAFRWTMFGFIVLCIGGSAFSIYGWIRNVRSTRKA